MDKVIKGFTLVEVLITLAVIGVLALMSLPTIINNINKQDYVTGLKKFYAVGNQALSQMANGYGCVGNLACTGVFNSSNVASLGYSNINDKEGSLLAKYFNVVKTCGIYGKYGGTNCWANYNANFDGSGTTTMMYDNSSDYQFVTADGMSVSIAQGGGMISDCGSDISANGGPLSKTCALLHVDINGPKGPNFFGRDVFRFFITNANGPLLYPCGGADQLNQYWKTSQWNCVHPTYGNDTSNCAGRVIEENWQMKY